MHGHGAQSGLFGLSWTGGDAALLPLALLIAGLAGGAMHCAPMCGPFVMAQLERRLAGDPGADRRLAALLLPYHLGRAATYSVLGAAAGWIGRGVEEVAGFRWLSGALLALAALWFLAQSVAALRRFLPHGAPGVLVDAVTRLARPLFVDPRGWRGLGLGAALGLLPCGLLYAALAAAAGSGGAPAGAAAMAAFALGTMPALVGVGWLGAFFERRWRGALRVAAVPLLVFNAAMLGGLAARSLAASGDDFLVGVPACVTDERDGQRQPDEAGREAEGGRRDDQRRP